MTRIRARLGAALLSFGLVAIALPASAHVNVSSTDATQGGYGKAVFKVPNESDKATTTTIVVTLPTETPFAFLTVGAKPGWKATLDTQPLPQPTKVGDSTLTKAVRTITWTATDGGIGVGEFDEFALSGGPFPKADSMTFKVKQVYSDGEVSDWSQVATGDAEPEKPAPVLTLAAATADGHGASHSAESADSTDDDDQQLGTWLGAGALVVAVAALGVALVGARGQNRRRA